MTGSSVLAIVLAIVTASCVAAEPGDTPPGSAGPMVLAIREASATDFVVPASAAMPQDPATSMPEATRQDAPPGNGGQDWVARPDRLAQAAPMPELIRPGTPSPAPGGPVPQPGTADASAQPSADSSPLDPELFRLPSMGLPPGLGAPTPTAETEKKFGQFVERQANPENTLQVVAGRALVLVFREVPRRIYIPREDVAEYQAITPQQLAVMGKREGSTVLNIWFPNPAHPDDPNQDTLLTYLVMVLQDPERILAHVRALEKGMQGLDHEINKAFPETDVHLSFVGNQVVVRGEVKDIVQAYQILTIVANASRQRTNGLNNVRINFLPGLGHDEDAVNAIRTLLQGNPQMVNLLNVPGEQQVMLMVTVAEVDRTAARTIGMDFSIVNGRFAFAQTTGGNIASSAANIAGQTVSTASPAAIALAQTGGNLPTALDNGNVLLGIQALRTMNFARSLAEPNLTTLNGRTANFRAGGAFPVPTVVVTPGGTAQSVTYLPFGIDLHFTPYITDRTRIRLVLRADVTTLSSTTTNVSGAAVPTEVDTRAFDSTVELREGQTLTVAGLIQNNFGGTSNRVPLWGDLPLIGRAGGLDSVTSGEQELVVLVTPVLVHPMERCQTPPLPGSDIFEPGDVEFFLGGHMESQRTKDFRASARTDFDRMTSYYHCEDRFIVGPKGATYGCCTCPGGCCPHPASGICRRSGDGVNDER